MVAEIELVSKALRASEGLTVPSSQGGDRLISLRRTTDGAAAFMWRQELAYTFDTERLAGSAEVMGVQVILHESRAVILWGEDSGAQEELREAAQAWIEVPWSEVAY